MRRKAARAAARALALPSSSTSLPGIAPNCASSRNWVKAAASPSASQQPRRKKNKANNLRYLTCHIPVVRMSHNTHAGCLMEARRHTEETQMKRLLLAASLLALTAGLAEARDQIRIVGSSTVYPFTTAVAEQFGKTGGFKTPVVESTGTGGGMKLFCAGIGGDNPDFTNASRQIKKSEFDDCAKNGVTDIVEIKIGFDGLTVANSKAGPDLNFTKQ